MVRRKRDMVKWKAALDAACGSAAKTPPKKEAASLRVKVVRVPRALIDAELNREIIPEFPTARLTLHGVMTKYQNRVLTPMGLFARAYEWSADGSEMLVSV